MSYLSAIFALLVAAAGWYYVFYSSAALRLSEVEPPEVNHRRVRLRQINGCLMMALGALFFISTSAIEQGWSAVTIAALLLAVLVLLLAVGILALLDLRMTNRLRRSRSGGRVLPRRDDEIK